MWDRSITGLRGILAINVVIAHFVSAFYPQAYHKNWPSIFIENENPSFLFRLLTSPPIGLLYNGHFAVIAFFIISGYVLTLPADAKDSNLKFFARMIGRYLRLNLPIFVIVFISLGIYKLGCYFNKEASDLSNSVLWFKNFFPNQLTATLAVREATYSAIIYGNSFFLPIAWTMQIEFLGSLYLLAYYILKKDRFRYLLLLIFIAVIRYVHEVNAIFYLSFFVGAMLHKIKKIKINNYIIIPFALYFSSFQFQTLVYDFQPQLHILGISIFRTKDLFISIGASLFCLLIIKGWGSKLLNLRIFQYLGRISYSVYLVHFLLLASIFSFIYVNHPITSFNIMFNFFIYLLSVIFCATIFEKFIDRKSITAAKKFSEFVIKKRNG